VKVRFVVTNEDDRKKNDVFIDADFEGEIKGDSSVNFDLNPGEKKDVLSFDIIPNIVQGFKSEKIPLEYSATYFEDGMEFFFSGIQFLKDRPGRGCKEQPGYHRWLPGRWWIW